MVSLQEALDSIAKLPAKQTVEIVALEQSVGRVCALEYVAKTDMPNFDNSAMDGYAVSLDDCGKAVTCKGAIYAGDNASYRLQSGTTYKIMTGAKLPKGCEAVVPVEEIAESGGVVTLPKTVKKLANMRFSGEDLKKDSVIVNKHKKITPYDIGVLASQGYSYVSVFKRVRVGVLSSGEELQPHYATLKSGQLFNSNAPTLESLCRDLGCDVTSSLVVKDSFDGLKEAFVNCLDCDIVITTGGASVGDRDFTKDALKALGAQAVFEKIDIKPGKPTSLYNVSGCYVLVLPGNPLAAMVNFELCGKALIKQVENSNEKYFLQIKSTVSKAFEKKGAKDTIVLGIYDGEGFEPLDLQLPGMVKPLQRANAFTIMAKEQKELTLGKEIKLFLLHSSVFTTKNQKITG